MYCDLKNSFTDLMGFIFWGLSFEVREWYCSNPLGRAAYRENNNESLIGFPCCEPGRSNLAWQQWNKYLSKESTFLFTSHWSVCFLLLLPPFFSLMDLHKYWDCRIAHLWNHSLGKTYLQLYAHTCTLEIHTNIYSIFTVKSIEYFKLGTRKFIYFCFFLLIILYFVLSFILCSHFHLISSFLSIRVQKREKCLYSNIWFHFAALTSRRLEVVLKIFLNNCSVSLPSLPHWNLKKVDWL